MDSRNNQEKKLDKIIDFLHTRPSDKTQLELDMNTKLADNELLRAAVEDLRRKLVHMCPNHEQLVLQYEIDLLKRALLDTEHCSLCLSNIEGGSQYEGHAGRHSSHKTHVKQGEMDSGSEHSIESAGEQESDGGDGGDQSERSYSSQEEKSGSEEDSAGGSGDEEWNEKMSKGKNIFVKRFLICEICKKIFKRRSALVRHRLTHSDAKKFTCEVCEKDFPTENNLKKHQHKKHGLQPSFTCNVCSEVFSTREECQGHKRGHAKEQQTCKICNKTLSSPRKLAAHMFIHSAERPHKCETCGKGFKQKKTLRKHKFIHKDKEKCEYCEKVLAHNSMRNHVETFHSDESWFACDQCPRKFRLKHHLISHQQMHGSGEQCTCTECGREFASKFALSMHMNSHKEVKKFKCSICYDEYESKEDLKDHMSTHSESDRKFQCDTCGKTFFKKQYLLRHQAIHSDVRHPCEQCGKAFTSFWNLREHQKLHSANKPFTCDECGKGFISQRYLELHQLSHSDIRPHQCDSCGKSFARLGHLNQHMKIHSGIRPYKCELCDKTFLDAHGLRKHLNSHMKPYYCEFCNVRHASQYKLNLHLKMKHSLEVEKMQSEGAPSTLPAIVKPRQQESLDYLERNVLAFMKVNYPPGNGSHDSSQEAADESIDGGEEKSEAAHVNVDSPGVTASIKGEEESDSSEDDIKQNLESYGKVKRAAEIETSKNYVNQRGKYAVSHSEFNSELNDKEQIYTQPLKKIKYYSETRQMEDGDFHGDGEPSSYAYTKMKEANMGTGQVDESNYSTYPEAESENSNSSHDEPSDVAGDLTKSDSANSGSLKNLERNLHTLNMLQSIKP